MNLNLSNFMRHQVSIALKNWDKKVKKNFIGKQFHVGPYCSGSLQGSVQLLTMSCRNYSILDFQCKHNILERHAFRINNFNNWYHLVLEQKEHQDNLHHEYLLEPRTKNKINFQIFKI